MSETNIAKIGSQFMRYRSIIFTEMANVYRPVLRRQKEDVLEIIKEKYSKALRSGFADKVRTAKGYYRLEMSPPGIDEMKLTAPHGGVIKIFVNTSYTIDKIDVKAILGTFFEMKLREDIALAKDFILKKYYKQLTVRQAWLLFLVVLEVGLWFFLGETIGKFHIVGYKV